MTCVANERLRSSHCARHTVHGHGHRRLKRDLLASPLMLVPCVTTVTGGADINSNAGHQHLLVTQCTNI
eukprot:855135-Pelagomonas_calceolata.AAC.3